MSSITDFTEIRQMLDSVGLAIHRYNEIAPKLSKLATTLGVDLSTLRRSAKTILQKDAVRTDDSIALQKQLKIVLQREILYPYTELEMILQHLQPLYEARMYNAELERIHQLNQEKVQREISDQEKCQRQQYFVSAQMRRLGENIEYLHQLQFMLQRQTRAASISAWEIEDCVNACNGDTLELDGDHTTYKAALIEQLQGFLETLKIPVLLGIRDNVFRLLECFVDTLIVAQRENYASEEAARFREAQQAQFNFLQQCLAKIKVTIEGPEEIQDLFPLLRDTYHFHDWSAVFEQAFLHQDNYKDADPFQKQYGPVMDLLRTTCRTATEEYYFCYQIKPFHYIASFCSQLAGRIQLMNNQTNSKQRQALMHAEFELKQYHYLLSFLGMTEADISFFDLNELVMRRLVNTKILQGQGRMLYSYLKQRADEAGMKRFQTKLVNTIQLKHNELDEFETAFSRRLGAALYSLTQVQCTRPFAMLDALSEERRSDHEEDVAPNVTLNQDVVEATHQLTSLETGPYEFVNKQEAAQRVFLSKFLTSRGVSSTVQEPSQIMKQLHAILASLGLSQEQKTDIVSRANNVQLYEDVTTSKLFVMVRDGLMSVLKVNTEIPFAFLQILMQVLPAANGMPEKGQSGKITIEDLEFSSQRPPRAASATPRASGSLVRIDCLSKRGKELSTTLKVQRARSAYQADNFKSSKLNFEDSIVQKFTHATAQKRVTTLELEDNLQPLKFDTLRIQKRITVHGPLRVKTQLTKETLIEMARRQNSMAAGRSALQRELGLYRPFSPAQNAQK